MFTSEVETIFVWYKIWKNSFRRIFFKVPWRSITTICQFLHITWTSTQLGASLDGIVQCESCGLGCVEISVKILVKMVECIRVCLEKKYMFSVSYHSDQNQLCYYQMQLQMFVTKIKYCDFVIWSKDYLFIDWVGFDEDFFNEIKKKSLDFPKFTKLELFSRFFSSKCGVEKFETRCIYKASDYGRPMFNCDNDDCEVVIFLFPHNFLGL